jgi:Transcriptional regulator containing PAS, AAA-type ATPase, and DNA-binding domains
MAASPSMYSQLCEAVGQLPPLEIVFGRSKAMQEVRQRLERIAAANLPVLIQGESGTGKDIIARLIHSNSPWEKGPFVKITCPAIPAPLLESELFGYEKGAFTGAYGSKPGRVEMAHRGTLFLDEIAELDLALQSKLLQVLQESQFCRIGATEDKKVEVRVVCATNRRLEQDIEAGTFRRDLFYRINVVNLQMCPLRERVEDIPDLANYFIEKYNEKFNQRARGLSSDVLLRLQRHPWPGNTRELENVIKRYVVFGTETVFDEALGTSSTQNRFYSGYTFDQEMQVDGTISLKGITKQAVRDVERQVILKSLQIHNWNRKRTARALRISYRALLYKIQEAGLPSRPMAEAAGEASGD